MADNDETSMIGYDPLAWMQETEEVKGHVLSDDMQSEMEGFPLIKSSETPNADAVFKASSEDQMETGIQREFSEIEAYAYEPPNDFISDQIQQIVLDSVQNIQNVSQLYEKFMLALEKGEKVDIDASAITTIDSATLQLILVLKRTAIKQEKEVSIDFPSDKFIEAANLLGLSEMLNVDQAASGFF